MEYLAVLLPSIVVGLLFWFAMRALLNADRSERQALAAAEKEAEDKLHTVEENGNNPDIR